MPLPAVFVGAALGMGISAILAPLLEPVTVAASKKIWPIVPIKPLDPGTLVVSRAKGVIDDGAYKKQMAEQGFSGDASDTFIKAAEQILGPGELLGMVVRGIIGPDKMASELARLGVSSESASNLAQMAETLLDPGTLVQAKFRGAPGGGNFESLMTKLGYTGESAATFEAVSKVIGGPSDMIRWAVREVFTPAIVTELGLGDEFPTEFLTQAAKIGMDEEIANNEWRAHWVLPSIGQGFEMLHRRAKKRDGSPFVLTDMERLLRVQDVMPFFRDLITQIAYRPYTRVDVRRMHKMGILTRDEVKLAYMDLGFNDVKAEGMTEFTIQYNTEGERDLTKTEIMRAFDRGVIDEGSTIDLLSDIGIPTEAASIIIATQLAKVAMDETDDLTEIEIDRYIDGMVSETELQDVLATFELTASQIERLMAKSRRQKRRAEKMPTKADVLRWRIVGLVDRETADTLLERLGFPEEFRVIYLQESEVPEKET